MVITSTAAARMPGWSETRLRNIEPSDGPRRSPIQANRMPPTNARGPNAAVTRTVTAARRNRAARMAGLARTLMCSAIWSSSVTVTSKARTTVGSAGDVAAALTPAPTWQHPAVRRPAHPAARLAGTASRCGHPASYSTAGAGWPPVACGGRVGIGRPIR